MSLGNHKALVRWMSSNHGYLHPNIELAFSKEKGYHARVAGDRVVNAGTCVARCSVTTTLSVLNALHTPPFSCRGTKFPDAFLRNQKLAVVQCFFLMEQWLLQDKSWWAPYLSTLPQPADIEALFFTGTKEDLLWLKGTNLEAALLQQTESCTTQLARGTEQLKGLGWPSAVNNKYTWELFRWAFAMFGSRSFTSQVLSNTLPADKARPMGHMDPDHEELSSLFEDGFAVLLPLLDLLNHRPLSKVEWQAGLNEVGLRLLDSFASGEEVCNNYGPRDNDALVMGYGFAIPSNPFDHYVVGFKVPPGSPLAEARAWRAAELCKTNKKSKTDDEYRYLIFNVEHPRARSAEYLENSLFSQDLFDSISVLSANFRELQSHTFRSTRFVLDINAKRLTNRRRQRNLLHTLAQLRLECDSRSLMLRASDSTPKGDDGAGMSQKQQYAITYRDSQLAILEIAALLCRYCLLKAQTRQAGVDLITAAAGAQRVAESSDTVLNLRKLVLRSPSATKNQVLFSFSDALKLFPEKLAIKIKNAADICTMFLMQKASSKAMALPITGNNLKEKIEFTVFLAGLRNAYVERLAMLSSHLGTWMTNLQNWYPLDDQFWNGPTEEFLPMLEALVEAADQITPDTDELVMEEVCSDPQLLCWGWNVQEEEGVFSDVERLLPNGDIAARRQSNYLLCIPGPLEGNELPN